MKGDLGMSERILGLAASPPRHATQEELVGDRIRIDAADEAIASGRNMRELALGMVCGGGENTVMGIVRRRSRPIEGGLVSATVGASTATPNGPSILITLRQDRASYGDTEIALDLEEAERLRAALGLTIAGLKGR